MSTQVTVQGRCSSVITVGPTGSTASAQTLSFDSDNQLLSISDGNSVSLNHFLTTGEADARYLVGSTGDFLYQGIGYIDLNPSVGVDYQEGRIFYDSDSKALSVYGEISGVTLQVGQEQYLRVRNNLGSTITNGQVVYINGIHGNAAPTVGLAIATGHKTAEVIGVATHDISTSSFGYVTNYGLVRDLDLSNFSVGQEVYLSSETAGGLTGVQPSSPNYQASIGFVVNNGASNGSLFVKISQAKLGGGDIKSFNGIQKSGVAFVHSTPLDEGGTIATYTGFVFDSGNNRLGIRVSSPQATLHVDGSISGKAISGTSLQVDNLTIDDNSVVVQNKFYISGTSEVPDLYIVSDNEGIGDPSIKFVGADQINSYRWRLGVGSSVAGANFSFNQYGGAEMLAIGLGNTSDRYGIWTDRVSVGTKQLTPAGFSIFSTLQPVALYLKDSTPTTGSLQSGQISYSFDHDNDKMYSWIKRGNGSILSGEVIHEYSFAQGEVTGSYNNLTVDKIAAQKIGNVSLGTLGSGVLTLNLNSGDFFYGIQTGNLTIQVTGSYPSIANFGLDLLMSGSGSYTITLPASFQSLASTAPTIHSTTGQHNVIVSHTTDSGVNWLYALGGGSA